jgi:two-component system NarL family response regulator
MQAPLKLLLIDDHPEVAQALATRLRAAPGLEVLPPESDAESALRQAAAHRPAVVLVETKRSDGRGLELVSEIARTQPQICVIVLTSYPSEWEAWAMRQAGAADYLLKDIGTGALIERVLELVRSNG